MGGRPSVGRCTLAGVLLDRGQHRCRARCEPGSAGLDYGRIRGQPGDGVRTGTVSANSANSANSASLRLDRACNGTRSGTGSHPCIAGDERSVRIYASDIARVAGTCTASVGRRRRAPDPARRQLEDRREHGAVARRSYRHVVP